MSHVYIFEATLKSLLCHPVNNSRIIHVVFDNLVAKVFYFNFYLWKCVISPVVSFPDFETGVYIKVQILSHRLW